ncbi:hypothetical protein P3T73_08405 [Kiritimatiellota bacterium B12222]|nr:hypothetical protein P3T73_08405 [Kiritimatiellota bacterium B12222]
MMMRLVKGMSFLVLGFMICLGTGCDSGGGDSNGGDSNGGEVQSYAGEWDAIVCARELTMDISQEGSTLTLSYVLPDYDITDVFTGTVDGNGVADLMGDQDRLLAITFNSTSSFSGGFFHDGAKVCDISGSK